MSNSASPRHEATEPCSDSDGRIRVQVWHAPASSETPGRLEAQCESWMTEQERLEADRFRRSTTRNQHVIGRGMARRLLGGTQVHARSIEFQQLQHGKPCVLSPEAARQPFNVAHTEGMVLCGVADQVDDNSLVVGVDVERLERRTSPELADRYFAQPEIEFLRSFGNRDDRQAMFLRIWTLKESFIKAIGTGLYTPLADFAFDDIASDQPKLTLLKPGLDQAKHWDFHCFQPQPEFIAAVAVGRSTLASSARVEWHSFVDHHLT